MKLSDFGTVTEQKNLMDSRGKIIKNTVHTQEIGTNRYRAPETEGKYYDYKVDIFSLGVILFELITPFRTDSERMQAIDQLHNSPFPKEVDASIEKEVCS